MAQPTEAKKKMIHLDPGKKRSCGSSKASKSKCPEGSFLEEYCYQLHLQCSSPSLSCTGKETWSTSLCLFQIGHHRRSWWETVTEKGLLRRRRHDGSISKKHLLLLVINQWVRWVSKTYLVDRNFVSRAEKNIGRLKTWFGCFFSLVALPVSLSFSWSLGSWSSGSFAPRDSVFPSDLVATYCGALGIPSSVPRGPDSSRSVKGAWLQLLSTPS